MIPIGGVNPETMISQNVAITVGKGKKIRGVVGAIPPHINRGSEQPPAPSFEKLLIDVGADSREQAREMGIEVGQMITFVNQYYITEDGKKIASKAWDNRFGCGMALEILSGNQGHFPSEHGRGGATVQEEVGLAARTPLPRRSKPTCLSPSTFPGRRLSRQSHPRAFGKLGGAF